MKVKEIKKTIEDLDYTVNSWMYLIFAMLFLIAHYVTGARYWIYAVVIVLVFYVIGIVMEVRRINNLRRKEK